MKVTDLRRKLKAALMAGGLLVPTAAQAANLNTNLVVNPGFENVSFSTTGNYGAPQVLDWTGTGFAYSHDGSGGAPDYANGGPLAGGGSWYFTPGRPGPDIVAPGVFYQDIDVSTGDSGSLIAGGNAAYKVSAFFSGYLTQPDHGNVHLDFRNSSGTSLGTTVLTPPTISTWNQTFKGGVIPVGTATVRVSLFGTLFAGDSPDGYMDNIDVQVTDEVIQPFLELTVDRDTGGITLSNRTGSPVNLKSYSITSAFEGLEPANWLSIAENYDEGNPGPNQVDAGHSWSELTNPTANGDLSEADLESGLGASLGHTRTINLGSSPWIRTATEDLVFQYISGNQVVTGIVAYTGNDDVPFDVGDLNTDGTINSADWVILRNNQHTDLSSLSLAEAYRAGDLTGDKQNGHADFVAFKSIYEAANGSGSFTAMLADLGRVPEPSSVLLVLTGGLLMLPLRIRVKS